MVYIYIYIYMEETNNAVYAKRKKRSGQTYEENDRWILRPEQANIGLHP
jgi:hypothetical protein